MLLLERVRLKVLILCWFFTFQTLVVYMNTPMLSSKLPQFTHLFINTTVSRYRMIFFFYFRGKYLSFLGYTCGCKKVKAGSDVHDFGKRRLCEMISLLVDSFNGIIREKKIKRSLKSTSVTSGGVLTALTRDTQLRAGIWRTHKVMEDDRKWNRVSHQPAVRAEFVFRPSWLIRRDAREPPTESKT